MAIYSIWVNSTAPTAHTTGTSENGGSFTDHRNLRIRRILNGIHGLEVEVFAPNADLTQQIQENASIHVYTGGNFTTIGTGSYTFNNTPLIFDGLITRVSNERGNYFRISAVGQAIRLRKRSVGWNQPLYYVDTSGVRQPLTLSQALTGAGWKDAAISASLPSAGTLSVTFSGDPPNSNLTVRAFGITGGTLNDVSENPDGNYAVEEITINTDSTYTLANSISFSQVDLIIVDNGVGDVVALSDILIKRGATTLATIASTNTYGVYARERTEGGTTISANGLLYRTGVGTYNIPSTSAIINMEMDGKNKLQHLVQISRIANKWWNIDRDFLVGASSADTVKLAMGDYTAGTSSATIVGNTHCLATDLQRDQEIQINYVEINGALQSDGTRYKGIATDSTSITQKGRLEFVPPPDNSLTSDAACAQKASDIIARFKGEGASRYAPKRLIAYMGTEYRIEALSYNPLLGDTVTFDDDNIPTGTQISEDVVIQEINFTGPNNTKTRVGTTIVFTSPLPEFFDEVHRAIIDNLIGQQNASTGTDSSSGDGIGSPWVDVPADNNTELVNTGRTVSVGTTAKHIAIGKQVDEASDTKIIETYGTDANINLKLKARGAGNVLIDATGGGTVVLQGNANIGDDTSATITFTGRVNSSLEPSASTTYDLGAAARRWNTFYAQHGNFSGNMTFGDATTDTITFTGRLASSMNPGTDVSYDLGSATVSAGNAITSSLLYRSIMARALVFEQRTANPTAANIGTANLPDGALYYNYTNILYKHHDAGTWKFIVSLANVTKGTLAVGNGTNYTALAVGANDTVLIADSAEASGVRWGTPSGTSPWQEDAPNSWVELVDPTNDVKVGPDTKYILIGDIANESATEKRIKVAGSDANIGLKFLTKGTGDFTILTNSGGATGDIILTAGDDVTVTAAGTIDFTPGAGLSISLLGDTIIGNSSSDAVVFTAELGSDVTPDTDVSYKLGSPGTVSSDGDISSSRLIRTLCTRGIVFEQRTSDPSATNLGTGTYIPKGAMYYRSNLEVLKHYNGSSWYTIVSAGTPAKGDVWVGGGTAGTVAKLPVGSDNTVLMADSSQTHGVKWGTPSGGMHFIDITRGTEVPKTATDNDFALATKTITSGTIPANSKLICMGNVHVRLDQSVTSTSHSTDVKSWIRIVKNSGTTNGTSQRIWGFNHSGATVLDFGSNTGGAGSVVHNDTLTGTDHSNDITITLRADVTIGSSLDTAVIGDLTVFYE